MNYMQAGAATWHDTTGPPPQAFDLGLTSALRIKKQFNALYQHKSSFNAMVKAPGLLRRGRGFDTPQPNSTLKFCRRIRSCDGWTP
jgi:hypothetical protein